MPPKKTCEGTIKKNGLCNECGYPLPNDRTKQKGPLTRDSVSPDHKRKCKRTLVWSEDALKFLSQKEWKIKQDHLEKMTRKRR